VIIFNPNDISLESTSYCTRWQWDPATGMIPKHHQPAYEPVEKNKKTNT
jgi:hypothetical protein